MQLLVSPKVYFAIARWVALAWVLVWLPLYTRSWGWRNMLHLCDVSVVVACLGLWFRNSLLVSSQALLSPLVGVVWTLDISWRMLTGHHLFGGTEYMWDAHYALWLRLLSCFHIVLPIVLLWALQVLGYDPGRCLCKRRLREPCSSSRDFCLPS